MQEKDALLEYFNGDEMSASVWKKKYAMRDADGELTESTPDDMHRRMAKYFAEVEEKYDFSEREDIKLKLSEYGYNRVPLNEERIYQLFKDFKYVVPGGSVMSGLGSPMPVSLSNCFIAGTQVLTREGYKNIEDIQIGEYVLSHDGEYHKVENTLVRYYEGDLYKIGSTEFMDSIICTPNHKFLTDNDWKRAEELTIDSKLRSTISGYKPVEYIEVLENQSTKVYNLSVADTHTYNVNGVICHNCFVVKPVEDSLDDIFRVCNESAQLFKRRGGNGFDISGLRPLGSTVSNSARYSTGAPSFMELFSTVTTTIGQQGRRGALMLSIHIDHPDSKDFIEKKQDLTKVTGANISVQIGDDFVKAVLSDSDYYQRWPINADIAYDEDVEYGVLNEATDKEGKKAYYKKIKAKELWDVLIHCAWNTAEPGIIFKSKHYNYSPDGLYPQFRGTSTNPCLVGDTMITTKDGDIAIKEIVERVQNGERIEVLTYNEEDRELEYKVVEAGQLTRKDAETIRIALDNDNEIRLTPEHQVYTQSNGWKKANSISIEDTFLYVDGKSIIDWVVIEDGEKEDVYDLKVQDNHNFFANGILVHNCGEIFMNEDSCRLIHINLSSFVENPFTENARVDEQKLYEVAYETMRLGDDLVDLEQNAINRILKKIEDDGDKGGNEYKLYERLLGNTLQGRRCGVGIFGIADAVAKLGHKLDTDESLKVIDQIMKVVFVGEMDSEIDMAITRGSFPAYSKEIEDRGNDWYSFLENNFPHIYGRMKQYGRRNVSFSTAAPTGTVAMLSHCSSGIEPVFMPFYTRRVKCMNASDRVDFIDKDGEKFTEYITVHPTLKEFAELKFGDTSNWTEKHWQEAYEKSPWYKACANDIEWEKRVKIQGTIQKYISHSISSTCGLPNDVTEETVSGIYIKAWEDNLKGITVYRDGCRGGIFVSSEKKEEKKKDALIENGTAKRRPKTISAKILRFSNKGEKWVAIVGMLDGKPYELFTGMLEKLNIPNWVEEGNIVKNYEEREIDGEMKKKSRYDFCYMDKDGYRVCVEGVSRIFNPEFWNYGKLVSGLLRHNMPISYIVKVISSLTLDDQSINTWKNGVVRTLRKFGESTPEEMEDEVCPDCGGRLLREGGCIHCVDCGWSRCG